MTRRRIYDAATVRNILFHSEGRPTTFRSGKPGHAYEEHVGATRARMMEHAMDVQQVSTAFLPDHNLQVQAAVHVLNHHAGQGALDFLDFSGRTGKRVIVEAPMGRQSVRLADATKTWTDALENACMLIDRTEGTYGIHIHTLFPILGFRRGCPSWWPDTVWQFPTGQAHRP